MRRIYFLSGKESSKENGFKPLYLVLSLCKRERTGGLFSSKKRAAALGGAAAKLGR
jgi:hypothetical protein